MKSFSLASTALLVAFRNVDHVVCESALTNYMQLLDQSQQLHGVDNLTNAIAEWILEAPQLGSNVGNNDFSRDEAFAWAQSWTEDHAACVGLAITDVGIEMANVCLGNTSVAFDHFRNIAFCANYDFTGCYCWVGSQNVGFGPSVWRQGSRLQHLEDRCIEGFGGVGSGFQSCCGRSEREKNNTWIEQYPQEENPWPKTKSHCQVDSFGRELCRAPACLSKMGMFIMPGEFGEPLIGWPDFYTGLNFEPPTQVSQEQKYDFDFPRGFRWKSVAGTLQAEHYNDKTEWAGQAETKNHVPIYGFRAPQKFTEVAFDIVGGPVLIIGWPGTKNSNIYNYFQYALSALMARWRYNLADEVEWSAVIVSDPGKWLALTDWAPAILQFMLGSVHPEAVVHHEQMSSKCFADAIFAGWGDIPMSGPHDMARWRFRLTRFYVEFYNKDYNEALDGNKKQIGLPTRKRYITISLRQRGWNRLQKNLANKIFGYLARCEFWLKLRW